MPLKFIIPVVLIVGAAGVAVYENIELREQIQEFVANARRKLAASLHSIADNVTPQQHREPIAMSGGAFSADSDSERNLAETTGRQWGASSEHELRQRGGGIGTVVEQDNIALFDGSSASSSNNNHPASVVHGNEVAAAPAVEHSRRSSTATMQTPRTADFEIEPESGYESQPQASVPPVDSTPRSQSSTGAGDAQNPFVNSQPFWSIHEWAENTSAISSPSLAGSAAEELGDAGTDDEGADLVSVSSWTEVGSEVSDDHH
ncbi:hypothetical protein EDC01DRAFT_632750 [Geopyxis carbonaria]|nr:hypothetical protein EDC01DRAFT_632750 [Geopyxis carbonaria]